MTVRDPSGKTRRFWRALARRITDERGEAGTLAMLALTPALIMLTFGTTQFWFWSRANQEVEIAATEGARRAALADGSFADGADYARWFVKDATVDGAVVVTGSRGATETTMTVTAQCRWFVAIDLFGTGCTISRTATVPTERFEPGVLP